MTQIEESLSNESMLSIAECEELKKNISLSSSDLIELTYHEDKFIGKLDEFNKIACTMIEEDKYQHASVYLNEAERILQYAAGCGKTIERTAITTILNNQATLLQRTSQFTEAANYLQAIIYNINQFIESSTPLPEILQQPVQAPQLSEISTILERKLSLSLYQLRFAALASQNKNHQAALSSAKKALNFLREICQEEYSIQIFLSQQPFLKNMSLSSESEIMRTNKILKDLPLVKEVNKKSVEEFEKLLEKCIEMMSEYNGRISGSSSSISSGPFENYSIGNLMQASCQQLNLNSLSSQYLSEEVSPVGKLFKVIYMSMAHFTIATELRFISSTKYSLDEGEKKKSQEFLESRIYHLLSLGIIAKYLHTRSVFFEHALSSFRNHYGIDLLDQMNKYDSIRDKSHTNYSILEHKEDKLSQKSLSHIDEVNTCEGDNKSIQINQIQNINDNQLAANMLRKDHPTPKLIHMNQIQNKQMKKIKFLKSKSKNKHVTTSFSRVLDSNRILQSTKNINMIVSKNKQNKGKEKMGVSKGKQTIRSRRKQNLKTENDTEDRKGIYYGFQSKSRSKSKKSIVESRNSKKNLTKTDFAFQNRKLKNETKINQEYGVKSTQGFVDPKHNKTKIRQHTTNYEEENIYLHKSPRHTQEALKVKKLKSPSRTSKCEHSSKRKSLVSRQKCII